VQKLLTHLRKPVVLAAIAVFVFFAWLAFRPELLFVNKTIDEPFPATTSGQH